MSGLGRSFNDERSGIRQRCWPDQGTMSKPPSWRPNDQMEGQLGLTMVAAGAGHELWTWVATPTVNARAMSKQAEPIYVPSHPFSSHRLLTTMITGLELLILTSSLTY